MSFGNAFLQNYIVYFLVPSKLVGYLFYSPDIYHLPN